MKTILPVLLLFSVTAKAQYYDSVKDSIIARFNRMDFKGIYEMADSNFKAAFTEKQITGLLNSAKTLGTIVNSELITENKDNRLYRLFFQKKSLELSLNVTKPGMYNGFGLSFYKLPIVRTRVHFLSGNPLTSRQDSVVQQAVTPYMSNKNVAGLSVGICRNDSIYLYHFGETTKGNGQLPGPYTIFEIGSITKTFTGILLAHAVLEGKLNLEDDIRKYLNGDYPNLEYAGQPIRMVHLSNHTSALPSMPKLPPNNEDPFNPSTKFTDELLKNILHNIKLDTLPGARRAYSNFAVGLLGLILENVYGMSYEQLLKKYIFNPYGMRQSCITVSPEEQQRYATGYDLEGNITTYWRNRLAEPAGGIRSTAYDMLMYIKAQLNPDDKAAQLSHKLTFGNVNEGTGLNWGIMTTKTGHHLRWSHDGGTDGFTSLCLIYPELKSGIILLTNNGNHFDDSFYDIGRSIYNSWLQ